MCLFNKFTGLRALEVFSRLKTLQSLETNSLRLLTGSNLVIIKYNRENDCKMIISKSYEKL